MRFSLALVGLLTLRCLHSGCDDRIWLERPSPSGEMKVTVRGVTCGTVSGFRVEVAPISKPKSGQTIFMATTRRDATDPANATVITVDWLTDKRLKIVYPNWIAEAKSGNAPRPHNEPDYGLSVEYEVRP
jgi:hypothetical protein